MAKTHNILLHDEKHYWSESTDVTVEAIWLEEEGMTNKNKNKRYWFVSFDVFFMKSGLVDSHFSV